jgi:beta-phosphoglucomutase
VSKSKRKSTSAAAKRTVCSHSERPLLGASATKPRLAPCYDAVFFDFDGVLADTELLHYACWRRIFASRGGDLRWGNYNRFLRGYSGEELLSRVSRLSPRIACSDQIQNMYAEKKLLYRQLTDSLNLIPETVVEFVRRLPIPCAVVTSSARVDVERVLRKVGLLSRFNAVVCCNQPKPAPNGYQEAMSVLCVKSPLAVEDSDPGVQSATAAGLEVLRVSSPAGMPALVTAKLYGWAPACQ